MNHSSLLVCLTALLVGSVAVSVPGCSSDGSSAGSGDIGAGASASSSAGAAAGGDSAGPSGPGAGGDASGPSGDAGAPGSPGAGGDAGGSGHANVNPLPANALMYVYSDTADSDWLVVRDLQSGEERLITDLRADGSEGWEIWGHSLSPDRRRIVIASLFDPSQADVDTGLATRRIWTLAVDGSDFQRLTPVFENTGEHLKNFQISVDDPVFSADGRDIIYDFGNWWYEGTTLEGGSLPWSVAARGGVPMPFETTAGCSIIHPSVNPATGEVLFVHSVCVRSDDEGLFLYPPRGGTEPIKLVDKGFGPGAVDPSLEKASWLADGSGFTFIGNIEVTRGESTEIATSLLAFDMTTQEIRVLVIPDAETSVRNAAVAPDGSVIVYCLAHDGGHDLHAIDLTLDEPEDVPITDDGKSCSPGF